MQGTRDLRIDFIRGFVMFILIVSHIEVFSIYNLIAWERLGLVSGAGGFVILAGYVVGMIYRSRLEKNGIADASQKLIDRALQLYRVNVFIIASVLFLRAFTIADVKEVTTFTDRAAGTTYALFTSPDAPIANKLADTLLLRAGPHQMQILGLYVVLLAATPLLLWLMRLKRTRLALGVSAVLYVYNWAFPTRLTGAQFENAFSLLNWQLIYVCAVATGYHRERVFAFMASWRGRIVFALAVLVVIGCFLLAQNTPNPFIPAWARASFIAPEEFDRIRLTWFDKNTMGPGRAMNFAALMIVGYALLTRFWKPLARAFGWFLIPIGQASLYVFIVHVYVVLLVSNVVPFGFSIPPQNMLFNTIVHTAALAILWLMVRYQVLFGWIPR